MAEEDTGSVAAGKNKDGAFFTYGVSNLAALFVGGGLLGIGTVVKYFIGSLFEFPVFRVAGMAFSPILYVPELIVMVFVLGYLAQCVRELAKGNHRMMLPALNSLPSMTRDGVMGGIVLAEYYLVVTLTILLTMSIPQMLGGYFCAMAVLALVAMVIVTYPLEIVAFTSWVAYSRTGDLSYAVNPLNGIGLIRSNFGHALKAAVFMIAVSVPLALVSLFLPSNSYLSIVIPWLSFYRLSSYAFIFNEFYEATAKGKMAEGDAQPA